jgi:hypothetical protein
MHRARWMSHTAEPSSGNVQKKFLHLGMPGFHEPTLPILGIRLYPGEEKPAKDGRSTKIEPSADAGAGERGSGTVAWKAGAKYKSQAYSKTSCVEGTLYMKGENLRTCLSSIVRIFPCSL